MGDLLQQPFVDFNSLPFVVDRPARHKTSRLHPDEQG